MEHSYRTPWTDELVEAKILECVNGLELNRMPSRQEFHDFYGNDALTNRIRRSGGYYDWAIRLGLKMKSSETQIGKDGELLAKELLERRGFTVERMTTRYPYDLYVDGAVKVDVKTAHLTQIKGYGCYSFNLEKRAPTCDIYFLIALGIENETVYIVPAFANQTQICIGAKNTIYKKYIDRYDIIQNIASAHKSIG